MPLPTAADVLPKTDQEASVPAGSEIQEPTLPDVLLELPVMYGLMNGAPAAVYAEKTSKAPEVKLVVKHQKELQESGFGFYFSNDKKLTVMYNSVYVTEDQLKEADAAGTLTEVAAPLESASESFGSAISGGGSLPGSPAASAPPPSSSAQRKIATARAKNLQPGSPTSGPSPGAGRILNNILKPTI